MKKLLSLLLCGLLLLGLFAGCAGKTPEPTESGTAAVTDPPVTTTEAVPVTEEYSLEREPGTNQLIFYWTSPGVDYSKCDMWIWYPNADGHGYLFHPCEYGVKVILNVPEDITEVGFIVRKNCSNPGGSSWGEATKDFEDDRFASITGPVTEIYLKPGEAGQFTSTDGGKTLNQTKFFSMAAIIALNQIKYNITPAACISSLDQIQVLDGDRPIEIADLSSLNNTVVTGVITLKEDLDFSKTYTVKIEGYGELNAVPTKVFDSPEFISRYTYEGDDLGAVIQGENTVFKLWAPTASKVVLNLFAEGEGGAAADKIEMEKGEKGVWSATVPCGHGTYYTYSVTTCLGTQDAVDPYARAVGVNGNRGMVIDLASTDPEGFDKDRFYSGIDAYNQAVIWEVHVRDFSNTIAGSKYPGKYLAFTETGLTNAAGKPAGMDYLTELGITHVHLQPVYDYATVNEASDEPQFNWGYDPKNYNAPEGSYSTDPWHGEVRVNEFKQMVQALHENGMGVVMDVVYNHTYSLDSNLNRVVPYYYYRFNSNGSASNGSGCGNETASDRAMFRKYMVDSVSYWAKEYHVDGFRFDLMALHDVQTMQAIEEAVHAINPRAILYGEGWTGGTTPLNSDQQADRANIGKVKPTGDGIGAVAVFNDTIRDGLKGSVFDVKDRGYINGSADRSTASRVIFGIMGGVKSPVTNWSVENNGVINYMACHDNNTIWDKLLASKPDQSDEERFEMNGLGISIIMLSKGVPFFLAGEEMLRTKQGDSNSYASSDAINNLDWDSLTDGSLQLRMHDFYRDLIAMRKANSFFTEADVSCEIIDGSMIQVTWSRTDDEGETVPIAMAVINPGETVASWTVPEGEWQVLLNGESAFTEPQEAVSGEQLLPAKTVLVIVSK